MRGWSGIVLLTAILCGLLVWSPGVLFAEDPPQAQPHFPVCEERRDNPTEYDRCVGNEINKQLADMNKNDQLDLGRCSEFLAPYDKVKYEACVGEEFNKFPEYGPEVKAQYLAGQPWSWPDREPPWWDDYYPVVTPEAPPGGVLRWWEKDCVITPEPPRPGSELWRLDQLWADNWAAYGAPPQW